MSKKRWLDIRNLLISSVLFILLIFVMHITLNKVNEICISYLSELDEIETLLTEDKFEESYAKSMDLLNSWIDHSNYSTILFNHIDIELVTSEFMRATQYIKCKYKVDALSSIHTIKFNVDAIMNMQTLTFGNIL